MNKLKTIFAIEWKRIVTVILFTLVVVTKWSEHEYDFYFLLLIFLLIISIFVVVFNVIQISKRTNL